MVQSCVLVSPINAIRISVTQPFLRYALGAIPHFIGGASKFCFFVALSVV